MGAHRTRALALLVVVVVVVQVAASVAHKNFYLTQLTMAAYYSLVVLGLSMLMGYAGQASMGQAGFFAIGGYLVAFLTTRNLAGQPESAIVALLRQLHLLVTRPDPYGGVILHVRPGVAFVAGVAAAAAVAWLIARPVFRLRGHYLAMATLGFGIIVHRLFLGSAAFGEADGISAVPPLVLGFGVEIGGRAAVRVVNYYLSWAAVVLALWMLLNLVESRVGRALRAIHGSENAAAAVGIPIAEYKVRTFVLGAVLAAVAGALLTFFNGGVGPSEASVMKSVRYVAIVAVGGMANLWGALIMGVLLNFLSLRGYFGTLDDLVFGGILILMMLFAPEGIVRSDLLGRIRGAVRGRAVDDDAA